MRNLYVAFGAAAGASEFVTLTNSTFGGCMLESKTDYATATSVGRSLLLQGPLFKASYWRLSATDK
jgi:hypothetical protein